MAFYETLDHDPKKLSIMGNYLQSKILQITLNRSLSVCARVRMRVLVCECMRVRTCSVRVYMYVKRQQI